MNGRVTVTVSGLTGSGKSAIYGEIVTALTAIGVPVEHANPKSWRAECHMTHADWESALGLYQPTVTMTEQNISRAPHSRPSIRALLRGLVGFAASITIARGRK